MLCTVLDRYQDLDPRLANYVFFPLSHVFQIGFSIPSRAFCLSFHCLGSIIQKGWREEADLELVKQLLFLLTIHLSQAVKANDNDDLTGELLWCLGSLFQQTPRALRDVYSRDKDRVIPVVGQIFDASLTLVNARPIARIQIRSLEAIESLLSAIQDRGLLLRFLPGIVSQLTRFLEPSVQRRRLFEPLVKALTCLSSLFRQILTCTKDTDNGQQEEQKGTAKLGPWWDPQNSSQVFVALTKILKLQSHEKPQVAEALCSLCLVVLQEGSSVLGNCRTLAVEAILNICAQRPKEVTLTRAKLVQLASENPHVAAAIKELCHKWLSSLPRGAQSASKEAFEHQTARIGLAYYILGQSLEDVVGLSNVFIENMHASVAAVFDGYTRSPLPIALLDATAVGSSLEMAKAGLRDSRYLDPAGEQFEQLQKPTLESLKNLLLAVKPIACTSATNLSFARSILLGSPQGSAASLWMLARLIELDHADGIHSRSALHSGAPRHEEENYHDLALDRSLVALKGTSSEATRDWRVQASALEVLSMLARHQQHGFRSTLVDTLYPIVEVLGSREPLLIDRAVRCLNEVSRSCGYNNAGDLIVENVDYLVNAIALKLNTFDLDPRAPQVLTMMLGLSGSALIPFLDDTLESIFSLLASYHGYSHLVDSFFKVLSSVVKEAAASPELLRVPSPDHKKPEPPNLSLRALLARLDGIEGSSSEDPERRSFNDAGRQEAKSMSTANATSANQGNQEVPQGSEEREKVPKVYTTVESIMSLCQFYLTLGESDLRRKLLDLTATGCSVLARNENRFLPLVNDLWPVVVKRLYEDDPLVSQAAMKTLSRFFEGAGDFLASRVEDEWHSMRALYFKLETGALATVQVRGSSSRFTLARQTLDTFVHMLVDLTYYVRISPEMEDDIFAMLGKLAGADSRVAAALSRLNEDALWLALHATSLHEEVPSAEGFVFKSVKVI